MNSASFDKNVKLHTHNLNGMIRSYRVTRNFAQTILTVIGMILTGFDRLFEVLARPALNRIVRGTVAIACLISFLFLIGAAEQQLISLGTAVITALILVGVEILCLRGK